MEAQVLAAICEAHSWAGEVVIATMEDSLGTPLCSPCDEALSQKQETARAVIDRYRLIVRSGRYAWYYAYQATIQPGCQSCAGSCAGHDLGRVPLASARDWCRRNGATEVVETWRNAP